MMVMPTIDVTPPIICMMEVIDARRLAWTSGRCCHSRNLDCWPNALTENPD
jgi:hypothetical protein